MGFPGGPMIKNPPSNAGDARDVGSITRIGRSPRERNGNPLQYSCLENSIYRERGRRQSLRSQESDTPKHACI